MKKNRSLLLKFLFLGFIHVGASMTDYAKADKINNLSHISSLTSEKQSTIDIFPTGASSFAYPNLFVAHTESNAGDVNTKNYTIAYYLSKDSVLDLTKDIFLDTAFAQAQAPTKERYISKNFNLQKLKLEEGVYHILIVSDFNNVIDEYNENNNITLTAIEIYGKDSDLLFENTSYQTAEYTPGADIEATAKVKNNGISIAGGNYINYYLSKDNVIDSKDVLLHKSPIYQLNPGDTISSIDQFKLPQVDSGYYYLISKVDGDSIVTESNEDNNVNIQRVHISDFIVDLIPVSLHDTIIAENGFYTIEGHTINIGENISYGTDLNFYISNDTVLDSSDKLLGMDYLGRIQPQGKLPFKFNFPISEDSYYLIIQTDSKNQNHETNEANNITYVYIKGKRLYMDLRISNIKIVSLYNGNKIKIEYNVYNSGNTISSKYTFTYFYISKDSTYSADDQYLGYTQDEEILPGQNKSNQATLNLPQSWSDDNYIIARADGYKTNDETNENNNDAFVKIKNFVTTAPNIATSLIFPVNTGEIAVVPNPAGEYINVEINATASLDLVSYEIYDSYGSKFKSAESAVNGGKFTIPAYDLSQGIYLLKVSYGDSAQTIKVYKE
ncbi:CARDB domain-containing protein [Sporocytophaga myxococcoides]|uniref:CARDB domain-containing protein n=1 Tax=Sporocytophaga myxococcoides TaxID=153721 RepID=UPI0004143F8B|nr:CARDB domain-containing protein [Sporocytophaga myxococcoides]